MEKKTVWVIECRTGCSCCSENNFTQGPYLEKTEAEKIVSQYLNGVGNPLASQYAKYGRYNIEDWDIEILPDGRWIHEHEVFSPGLQPRTLLNSYGDVVDP